MKISNFCDAFDYSLAQKHILEVKLLIKYTHIKLNASKWMVTNTNFVEFWHVIRNPKSAYLHGKPSAYKDQGSAGRAPSIGRDLLM